MAIRDQELMQQQSQQSLEVEIHMVAQVTATEVVRMGHLVSMPLHLQPLLARVVGIHIHIQATVQDQSIRHHLLAH